MEPHRGSGIIIKTRNEASRITLLAENQRVSQDAAHDEALVSVSGCAKNIGGVHDENLPDHLEVLDRSTTNSSAFGTTWSRDSKNVCRQLEFAMLLAI